MSFHANQLLQRSLSDLYTSEKQRIRGIVAGAEFLSCATDTLRCINLAIH